MMAIAMLGCVKSVNHNAPCVVSSGKKSMSGSERNERKIIVTGLILHLIEENTDFITLYAVMYEY